MRDFLNAVVLVSELEASDAALVEAAESLWSRLGKAKELDQDDESERVTRELMFVGVLRQGIAEQIAMIRDREGLQVLGR